MRTCVHAALQMDTAGCASTITDLLLCQLCYEQARHVTIVFVLGVSSVSPCQHNEFLCRSTNQCIASSLTCNDVRDCDDGSDEDDKLANCAGAKQTVHANIFICMFTFCVHVNTFQLMFSRWFTRTVCLLLF